jgi:hypothetical protein
VALIWLSTLLMARLAQFVVNASPQAFIGLRWSENATSGSSMALSAVAARRQIFS